MPTHEVTNQVKPLVNYNLFSTYPSLQKLVSHFGAQFAIDGLTSLGKELGSEKMIRAGFLANENRPILKTHSPQGERIDRVEFHPAWDDLMRLSIAHGVHCSPWEKPRTGAHVARAAAMLLDYENEQGHSCPLTMTFGCIPTLRSQSSLAKEFEAKILTREYDPSFRPIHDKKAILMGMAMTEKQGGSDVRSNTTQAVPGSSNSLGQEFHITGHKWFCSAPMNDAFFVLAQSPKGLSCFFMPRWRDDGQLNSIYIQRLKDKLGDRSNASSEIEMDKAWSILVGEEGRGVPIIIEMANYTRLDCAMAATALMHRSLMEATNYCQQRMAFGKLLIDQPLMQNVLEDLRIESEAALAFILRLAAAFERQETDEKEQIYRRVVTGIAKFWLTKRSIVHTAEALEVLGGVGYVEESIMPRLYRQAPLNSIWEGSGNVMCLDVLRALNKSPQTATVLISELERLKTFRKSLHPFADDLISQLRSSEIDQLTSRRLVGRLATALQAVTLYDIGDHNLAERFSISRIECQGMSTFGALSQVD